MKTQLQICNNKLGWIPSFSKIIDGKEYALFDAIYTEDKQQMFDLKKQIIPHIKSIYNSYRIITRKNTLAIYVK